MIYVVINETVYAATPDSTPAKSNKVLAMNFGCSRCATCPQSSTHTSLLSGISSANLSAYAVSRMLSYLPHITRVFCVIVRTRFATLYPSLFIKESVASAHCG